MDRTKEFSLIVQATEVPQPPFRPRIFYGEIAHKYEQLQYALSELEKLTSYESFKMPPKLSAAYRLLEEYKAIPIDDNVSEDYLECVRALCNIVSTNTMRATLRLNELSRLCKRTVNPEERQRTTHPVPSNTPVEYLHGKEQGPERYKPNTGMATTMMMEEQEQQQRVREDFLQERRRIATSVNEIGQIVQDISIHVGLQEEQLIRIDDSLALTETWNKKALYELQEMWSAAKENRPFMIKFFCFWALVFILFGLLKRA